jgi:nickel-type superoxide dismutase maturation protease
MRIGKLLISSGIAATLASLAVKAFGRVEVVGDSMIPALEPGDRLLLVVVRPRVGDIVAVRDPRMPDRVLVKRVQDITADGVTVLGDNACASTDSRTFGPVPRRSIEGVAWYRYAPAHRGGRLQR